MTELEISKIASAVAKDTNFWIGLIGVLGAVLGSLITVLGGLLREWFKNRNQREIDKQRQEILKEMLDDKRFEWRNLETLASVIGCDEDLTKSHLIAIKARGSEKNDGKWGLISRHPLNQINQPRT